MFEKHIYVSWLIQDTKGHCQFAYGACAWEENAHVFKTGPVCAVKLHDVAGIAFSSSAKRNERKRSYDNPSPSAPCHGSTLCRPLEKQPRILNSHQIPMNYTQFPATEHTRGRETEAP